MGLIKNLKGNGSNLLLSMVAYFKELKSGKLKINVQYQVLRVKFR